MDVADLVNPDESSDSSAAMHGNPGWRQSARLQPWHHSFRWITPPP